MRKKYYLTVPEANAYLGNYAQVLSDLNKYVSARAVNYNPAIHSVTEASVVAYAGPGASLLEAYIITILDPEKNGVFISRECVGSICNVTKYL
jgi:hypothetical protein